MYFRYVCIHADVHTIALPKVGLVHALVVVLTCDSAVQPRLQSVAALERPQEGEQQLGKLRNSFCCSRARSSSVFLRIRLIHRESSQPSSPASSLHRDSSIWMCYLSVSE